MCKQSEGFVRGWDLHGNRQLGTTCTAPVPLSVCARNTAFLIRHFPQGRTLRTVVCFVILGMKARDSMCCETRDNETSFSTADVVALKSRSVG